MPTMLQTQWWMLHMHFYQTNQTNTTLQTKQLKFRDIKKFVNSNKVEVLAQTHFLLYLRESICWGIKYIHK